MNGILSILNSILIGLFSIALLFLGYFTYLFFRLKKNRLYLACMTLCLGAVLYIACNLALYNTHTVDGYISIVQVQKYGTFFYHIGLLWFALLFSGMSLKFLYPVAVFLAVMLAARQIDPGIIYSAVRGIGTHQLPWGEQLSILDASGSFWVYVYEAGYVYIYAMVIAAAAKLARITGNVKGKVFLAGSILLWLIAVYDILVFNLNLQWPFLGEAGFVALIMLLGFIISNDVIKAGMLSQKIAANERKLNAIFNSTFQSIGIIGIDGTIYDVNNACVAFTGLPREKMIGKKLYDSYFLAMINDDRESVDTSIDTALKNGFARGVIRMKDSLGMQHYIDYSLKPLPDVTGKATQIIVEGRDITELKRAEETSVRHTEELAAANEEMTAANEELESTNEYMEAQNRELVETQKSLVESETYNRILFSESFVPKIVLDPATGIVTDCNNAAVRIFGYESRDELIGKTSLNVSPPTQPDGIPTDDAARVRVQEALEKGNIVFEWRLWRPTGEIWDAEVHLMTFRNRGRKMMQLTLEDITQKKATATALRNSEERFRLTAENTGIMFFDYDIKAKTIVWSGAIEQITGYSENEFHRVEYHVWEGLIHPEDHAWVLKKIQAAIESVSSYDLEYRLLKKDGTYIMVADHGVVLPGADSKAERMLGLMSDITEKKAAQTERDKIQAQLIQAQKMEAIGTLASGLAHDFNNMLAGIMGSLSLLKLLMEKEDLAQPAAVAEYVKTATESAHRAADMVKHLLTISQKREIQPSVVDVAISLGNILKICKNSFPKSITLDFDIPAGPFLTYADPVELEQVFLNLCVNASHAMTIMRTAGQKEGGTLKVVLAEAGNDSGLVQMYPLVEKGTDYIRISIADNGVGMDGETQKRIFEPFFTTKGLDTGSGLGLSIAYGIIQRHKGLINVESVPGRGSTFTVYLPMYRDTGDLAVAGKPEHTISRGHGKVLIVDDESAIIKVAGGILISSGYEVVSCMRGDDAIALYREQRDSIAAVLLDMSMPGMSGLDILKELFTINPKARVLLSSGFAEDDRVLAARSMGIRGFIQKPYTAEELSRGMQKVLENRAD